MTIAAREGRKLQEPDPKVASLGAELLPPSEDLMADFITFSSHLIDSKDQDPIYPVLSATYDLLDLDEEQRLWFTFMYLAFYMVPSGLAAFRRHPEPELLDPKLLKLPMMMQRRNLRGGKIRRHVQSYVEAIEGDTQDRWVRNGFKQGQPERNFEAFWLTSQQPWGNGRWTSYKWAEILKVVHGYELSAPDMKLDQCLGPRRGLEMMYSVPGAPTHVLNRAGDDLKARMEESLNLYLSWEDVETCLCCYHSLVEGRYYIGHDIDQLQEQIENAPIAERDRKLLMDARAMSLPHEYLGEMNGWHDLSFEKRKVYQRSHQIVGRNRSYGERRAFGQPSKMELKGAAKKR